MDVLKKPLDLHIAILAELLECLELARLFGDSHEFVNLLKGVNWSGREDLHLGAPKMAKPQGR